MVRIKEPRTPGFVYTKIMNSDLKIQLDRAAKLSLTEQIRMSISRAIESGLLTPGTRLPSWQDLAAHLGVARGTVQTAYERLADAQMIETFGAKGTRVAPRPRAAAIQLEPPEPGAFMSAYQRMNTGPAIFQLGIPAFEGLEKLFARARSSNLLKAGSYSSLIYPDPRGEVEMRREIAGYLSISRNLHCTPEQVFITSGYSAGLGLALRVLGLDGKKVWMEDPGFFLTRKGLELARLNLVPIPVDAEGLNVDYAIEKAADAALAVLTPGQQAPLGSTLSLRRRLQLLEWAVSNDAWIIEDDYLSELQLEGRAAPALASLDKSNRVIHIGSFSKTISPGHYIRRVRRLKRLYCAQRDALCEQLRMRDAQWVKAGLAVLLKLPEGAPDVQIVRDAMTFGLAPSPLSAWFATPSGGSPGLLLGVATAPEPYLATACHRLFEIIERYCEPGVWGVT